MLSQWGEAKNPPPERLQPASKVIVTNIDVPFWDVFVTVMKVLGSLALVGLLLAFFGGLVALFFGIWF